MNSVILSIGSNTSTEKVDQCLSWLRSQFCLIQASDVYLTPQQQREEINASQRADWERPEYKILQYSNAVAKYQCKQGYEELNKLLKNYEKQFGRTDTLKARGIVPIDIDIVIFNGEVIRIWDYNQRFFQIGYRQISK